MSDGAGGDSVDRGGSILNPDVDTVFYDGPTQWDRGDVVRKCGAENPF